MAMSAICQRWRRVVNLFILQMLESVVTICDDESLSTWNKKYLNLSKLLLPDMALEVLKRRLKSLAKSDSINHPLNVRESEKFCLAWFHPLGIHTHAINLYGCDDDDENGIKPSNGEAERAKLENPKGISIHTVSEEWQGYRNATDVLIPFGYSTVFVRSVLQMASDIDLSNILSHNEQVKNSFIGGQISHRFQNSKSLHEHGLSKERKTTFAVRGCTFARPFGYCLCWEKKRKRFDSLSIESKLKSLSLNQNERTQFNYRLDQMNKEEEAFEKLKLRRRRDCLPRVVMSTKAKYPDLQGYSGEIDGIRQRSIQFLNADKSSAVYMRTSPFDCGEVRGPVTMFVVAIALEDGCFISGLEHRYEFGHLYGDQLDTEIEMSPICIATQCKSNDFRQVDQQRFSRNSIDSDFDDSGDSDESEDYIDSHCRCKMEFKRKFEIHSDESNSKEEHINDDDIKVIRGRIGPGRWHLYTALFNGNESAIRVDGVSEPVNSAHVNFERFPILDGLTIGSDHVFEMSLCFGEGSDGGGEGSISEIAVFRGALSTDDLEQIESFLLKKHGIIHGDDRYLRANQMDIIPETCEVTLKIPMQMNRWQENKWTKDAHALMVHAPPFEVSTGVPLRVAARHKSVAWSRMCEVTGKRLHVSRIGAKHSNGSSDW